VPEVGPLLTECVPGSSGPEIRKCSLGVQIAAQLCETLSTRRAGELPRKSTGFTA
jgi:hypothetical protein